MGVVVSSPHVSATPSSSLFAPAPAWGPTYGRQFSIDFSNVGLSHGLQPFTNCSNMCPFHRVQSLRNRLLQHGSLVGSQALPANLIQCRLPSMGSQPPLGIHLLQHSIIHRLHSGYLLPPRTTMGCRGTICFIMVSPVSCRAIFSLCLEHLLPLLLYWPWCLHSCFFHVSYFSLPAAAVQQCFPPPLLNMLSQTCCHHHWWAQLWPVASLSLAPAGIGFVWHGGIFSQKPTLQLHHYKNLATQTQYSCFLVKKYNRSKTGWCVFFCFVFLFFVFFNNNKIFCKSLILQ